MTSNLIPTPSERRRVRFNPLLTEMAARSQLTTEHPDAPGVCHSLLSALYSLVRGSFATE